MRLLRSIIRLAREFRISRGGFYVSSDWLTEYTLQSSKAGVDLPCMNWDRMVEEDKMRQLNG